MIYYLIATLLFVLQFFKFRSNAISRVFITIVTVCLAIIIGGRYSVGTDWPTYINQYNSIESTQSIFEIEPLFGLLMFLCKWLGLSYQGFFFVYALVTIGAIFYAFSRFKVNNVFLAFSVYFCCFFFQNQFNVIRQGTMMAFVWIALSYAAQKDFRHFVLFILIGAGFHYSAILFILLYWFRGNIITFYKLSIIVCISLFLYFTGLINLFLSHLVDLPIIGPLVVFYTIDNYEQIDFEEYGLTAGTFLNLGIVLVAYLLYHKSYLSDDKFRLSVNCLLLSFVITCALNDFSLFVQRLANCTNFATCIIIPYMISSVKKSNRPVMYIILLLYLILYLNKNLSTPGFNQPLQFLPYRFEWF